MVRWLLCGLLFFSVSVAYADPIVLLLLRMARDKAISMSLEAGVDSVNSGSTIPSPVYGFALPTPPIPRGTEEQRMRVLIDESFLYLTAMQRDAVFTGVQKILEDPRYARAKAQVVAEFTLKANAVRESYLSLDKLSYAEKRALAQQATEEFRRLPAGERRELLEVMQSGALPVPRDFSEMMLAEFSMVPRTTDGDLRRK